MDYGSRKSAMDERVKAPAADGISIGPVYQEERGPGLPRGGREGERARHCGIRTKQ